MQAVVQLHLSAIRSRKETEVVVLRYWKTSIFWPCCTELCPCQGSNFRMNLFSRSRENDRDSEGDEENDADW
jgi:hypothetical protein